MHVAASTESDEVHFVCVLTSLHCDVDREHHMRGCPCLVCVGVHRDRHLLFGEMRKCPSYLAYYLVPTHFASHAPHLIYRSVSCTSLQVTVERLIDQSLGKDERQTLFLSDAATPLPRPRPSREADAEELTFSNVPFEEHKVKRGGAAGAGGSQTKWYS